MIKGKFTQNCDFRLMRFITITFDKAYEKYTPQRQFQTTLPAIYRRLNKCSNRFEIYPELTLKGRIHYHIILLIEDYIKYHKSFLPYINKLGFIDVKIVRDYQNLLEYCVKDVTNMKNILNINVPITEGSKKEMRNYQTDNDKKILIKDPIDNDSDDWLKLLDSPQDED